LHDLIVTISFSAILAGLRCIHSDFFAWRLCQGAALHFVNGKTGVKDFDVWITGSRKVETSTKARKPTGKGEIILPPDTPGKTPEERLNDYITRLREPNEALFPSESLRHAKAQPPDSNDHMQNFLNNTSDLDLYWGSGDDFLKSKRGTRTNVTAKPNVAEQHQGRRVGSPTPRPR
jgi:hypothetical protein